MTIGVVTMLTRNVPAATPSAPSEDGAVEAAASFFGISFGFRYQRNVYSVNAASAASASVRRLPDHSQPYIKSSSEPSS